MIRIDPEFHAYIPALSDEERLQLENNIVADGCRDPLIVWNDILIDGHNRFEICTRLGLPFAVVEKDFADRDAALDWMDAHQLGRRNLTPDARKLLLGRRYNRVKMTKSEAGALGGASKCQSDTCLEPAAKRLATEHGVSAATVKRAGKFAAEVERDEVLKAAVEAGRSIASVRRDRAQNEAPAASELLSDAPESHDPVRRQVARLTTEAMIDEILGLREALSEAQAKNTALTIERDDLKEKLKEATSEDMGRALGNAQRRADAASGRVNELLASNKRMERKLNAALARVKELEQTPIDMDAP